MKEIIYVVKKIIFATYDAQNAMLFVKMYMIILVSTLLKSIGIRKNNSLRYYKKMLKMAKVKL